MKLRFVNYRQEFEDYSFQFDLLRFALQELGDRSFRRFMLKVREPLDAVHANKLHWFEHFDMADLARTVTKAHIRRLRKEFPVTKNLRWSEYKGTALLKLNTSELVLRVALFETFLKDIHRTVIAADPKVLALTRPKRDVSVKELFTQGIARIQSRETDRQVREGDKLSVKERAKFFREKLKLPWTDDFKNEAELVSSVDELLQKRHKIVHAEPDLHITDDDIKSARILFFHVPQICFRVAEKRFPAYFATF